MFKKNFKIEKLSLNPQKNSWIIWIFRMFLGGCTRFFLSEQPLGFFFEKFGLLSTERCHKCIDKTVTRMIKKTTMNGLNVWMRGRR